MGTNGVTDQYNQLGSTGRNIQLGDGIQQMSSKKNTAQTNENSSYDQLNTTNQSMSNQQIHHQINDIMHQPIGLPINNNPLPQLQQLMILLQQNQNVVGSIPTPQVQNPNSFGPGFFQAAQMLVQSQNQTNRYNDTPSVIPNIYNPTGNLLIHQSQTQIQPQDTYQNLVNQSMSLGNNPIIPGQSNQSIPHRQDFLNRDYGQISANQHQWMNQQSQSSLYNNYMVSGPSQQQNQVSNINGGMRGQAQPLNQVDQTNSPQIPQWAQPSQLQMMPQRNYEGQQMNSNLYDMHNMSLASITPQPIERSLKQHQQQNSFQHIFGSGGDLLQDDRSRKLQNQYLVNDASASSQQMQINHQTKPSAQFNHIPQESMMSQQFQQQTKRENFFNEDLQQFTTSSDRFVVQSNISKKNDDLLSNKNSVKNDEGPQWLQQLDSNIRQQDSRNDIDDARSQKSYNNNEKVGFTIAWPSKQQKVSENNDNDILGEIQSQNNKFIKQKQESNYLQNRNDDDSNFLDYESEINNNEKNFLNQYKNKKQNEKKQIVKQKEQFPKGSIQTSELSKKQINENNNFKEILTSGRFGASDDEIDLGGTTPINHNEIPIKKQFGSQFNQSQDSNNISSLTRNSKLNNRDQADEKSNQNQYDSNQGIQQPGSAGLNPLSIDDIPIVTKPKTFEELLEEEIAKGKNGAGGIIAEPKSPSKHQQMGGSSAPKRDFLKRNTGNKTAVNSNRLKSDNKNKQYRYYADNFDRGSTQNNNKSPNPQQLAQSSQMNNDKFDNTPINSNLQTNQPTTQKNPYNQWTQLVSEEQPDNSQQARVQKSPNSSHGGQVVKRPFLARGSGNAGGKGIGASNQKTPIRQNLNKENQGINPVTSAFGGLMNQNQNKSPLKQEFVFDQNIQNSCFESNYLDGFKNLEERAREQSKNLQNTYLQNQKKNQKIFEDEDSDYAAGGYDDQINADENSDFAIINNLKDRDILEHNTEDNRSNLVKKMFYNKESTQNLRQKQQNQNNEGNNQSSSLPDSVQRILEEKKEQLDKAIKYYNQEMQKVNLQKNQYEQQFKKLRQEQKELDGAKKKSKEQIDKLKEEELNKLKTQKKILEQRQKNVSVVNNSSKRDKDEIEQLRKQLTQVKEEMIQKDKYNKAQIDRLSRQVNDFRQENNELRDEIAHYDAELRDLRDQRFIQQNEDKINSNQKQNSQINNPRVHYTGIGQGVLNQKQSIPNSQQRINSVQRPASSTNQSVNNRTTLNNNQQIQKKEQEISNRQAIADDFQNQERKIQNDQKNLMNKQNAYMINNQQEVQSSIRDETLQGYNSADNNYIDDQNQDQENMEKEGDDDDEDEDYEMKLLQKYHDQKSRENMTVQDQIVGNDGKIQRTYINGKKEVIFSNGVKRETFPDGYTIVYFNNNDIKQTYPDQKIVYYFAEAKTTQTTYSDGLQVFKFSNQQIEKHFPDGTKEIIFPDGTIKCIFADGEEESIFTDGTIQRIEKNGVKAIEYASGQKDILYPDGTRVREYPDGRIKKTYPDGSTETSIKQD